MKKSWVMTDEEDEYEIYIENYDWNLYSFLDEDIYDYGEKDVGG